LAYQTKLLKNSGKQRGVRWRIVVLELLQDWVKKLGLLLSSRSTWKE
jgi:hypothetical protein